VRVATVSDSDYMVGSEVCCRVRGSAFPAGAPVAVCVAVLLNGCGAAGAVGFAVDLGRCCCPPVPVVLAAVFGAAGLVLQGWASGLGAGLEASAWHQPATSGRLSGSCGEAVNQQVVRQVAGKVCFAAESCVSDGAVPRHALVHCDEAMRFTSAPECFSGHTVHLLLGGIQAFQELLGDRDNGGAPIASSWHTAQPTFDR
jgi:hypothetical protein